jgi:hypothetical protein
MEANFPARRDLLLGVRNMDRDPSLAIGNEILFFLII